VEIAIGLPNAVPGTTGEQLVEWARRGERRGFSSLGTIDRITYGSYESLIALSGAAAVTERIGLVTAVLLAPLRDNGALLGKQALSLNALSGGRLTLGLGLGGRDDDFAAIDADMSSRGADMRPLGRALAAAVAKGRVALLNALGNGIADDKLVYAYVPDMIRYYLGEEPLIDNVPTYPCVDDARRAEVLDRLAELVLKPVDGYGGTGIVIGPHAERSELTELEKQVRAEPAKWVAQDMVSLSTHPTFSGRRLEPRAVDLRAFVFQSQYGGTPHLDVVPAALSRVAPPGSLIVNSSRGGGAKDTWILR